MQENRNSYVRMSSFDQNPEHPVVVCKQRKGFISETLIGGSVNGSGQKEL